MPPCSARLGSWQKHHLTKISDMKPREIFFAGGCFWGTEHFFKQIEGVIETQVGYANGNVNRAPTYQDVCTDTTGFAETVRVVYDEEKVGLTFLTRMYFRAIDPLSINRQGHDVGTQYRTGVYYTDPAQLPPVQAVFREEEKRVGQSLAVELQPLSNFFPAEDYHQDYLNKNPQGYCHLPLELFSWARRQRP